MIRIVSFLVGIGLLGATAHVSIVATGGYNAHQAPLLIGLACGMAIGSVAIGAAISAGQRTLARLLAVALIAGEVALLIQTAERVIGVREDAQSQAREAVQSRDAAVHQVRSAEAALERASAKSLRMVSAEKAKADADAAAQSKAAERSCAANCRLLLEQQVASAAIELAAVRAEDLDRLRAAEAALADARTVLSRSREPRSGTPLADRVGVAPWVLDLVTAALASVSCNGLGALLIAFACHARTPSRVTPAVVRNRRPVVIDAMPLGDVAEFVETRTARHTRARVDALSLYLAYTSWCDALGAEPLSPENFGLEFRRLAERRGFTVSSAGDDVRVGGLKLLAAP